MFRDGIGSIRIGFGTALRSNAGTDMIEPYRAPAPSYNYAPPPPPRPVYYVPPPPVRFGVVIGPGYGYLGRGMDFMVHIGSTAATLTGAGTVITGIKVCVEAAVSAAAQVKAICQSSGLDCSASVLISGNPACFSC